MLAPVDKVLPTTPVPVVPPVEGPATGKPCFWGLNVFVLSTVRGVKKTYVRV